LPLVDRTLKTIREFTADDGLQLIYHTFVAPSSGTVGFAKALNRSVTGTMIELVEEATSWLLEEVAPSEIGDRLNKLPKSALVGLGGQKRGFPRETFLNFQDRHADG
jgi:hypothetical protein